MIYAWQENGFSKLDLQQKVAPSFEWGDVQTLLFLLLFGSIQFDVDSSHFFSLSIQTGKIALSPTEPFAML